MVPSGERDGRRGAAIGSTGSHGASRVSSLLALAASLAARPGLWATAVKQYVRHLPRGWFRRFPFLPLPDREWVRFRLEMAYGDPHARIRPEDLIQYLEWVKKGEAR
jgi:hypothetical protein